MEECYTCELLGECLDPKECAVVAAKNAQNTVQEFIDTGKRISEQLHFYEQLKIDFI